jgi:hypothetical protein
MQFSSAAPRLPLGLPRRDKKWELLLLSPTASAAAASLKNCFQQVRAYYGGVCSFVACIIRHRRTGCGEERRERGALPWAHV